MILSDVSVKRPVFASVVALLLVAFGIVAFDRLPLREYPDIDPPIVSVSTGYPGAAANIVDTRITEIIEDRISGLAGIRSIVSSSRDGESRVTVEFDTSRDIDSAANDIRDRVSGVLDNLPDESDPPEVRKVDSSDDVILWFNLESDTMTVPQLTDYANRYLVDRFSVVNGVARVRVGGGKEYAMRVWLKRDEMAARGITADDIVNALRAENVELPAGSIESADRQFTARLDRTFGTPESFASLVLGAGDNGYLVRLSDVARVEVGAVEERSTFRGNGKPMVGLGIIKQSTGNILDVARGVNAEFDRVVPTLPANMKISRSYDTSVFVEEAVREVYKTLGIAIGLVVLVIFAFLGSVRAMLIPAVTVPVSLIATFTALLALGFSINLLTLLALVLAIGLVVDDSIVVLENIHRRMDDKHETRLVASFRGTRQVGFAVVATTVVLVAVFVPIAFLQGDIGRLFSEFALTMAAAVIFSSVVALTLTPMLATKILRPDGTHTGAGGVVDKAFRRVRSGYRRLLSASVTHPKTVVFAFLALLAASGWLLKATPGEYAPREDRGAFFLLVNGPQGATYDYMKEYMDEVERRMMPYVESGEMTRLIVRAPRGFGNTESFDSGIVIVLLKEWSQRGPAWDYMNEVQELVADLPGVRAFPVMRQGFGGGIGKPVQFVVGGGTYPQLAEWRDSLLERIAENPNLTQVDSDYKETRPQLQITTDYARAADLGVTVSAIGQTLETMLGSRRVTTYIDDGEEYDVILEGERDAQRTPTDIDNIYVRSNRTGQLIPLSNLVKISESADSDTLNRYNRVRAITIEANLADGYSLGEALTYLEGLVAETLPETAIIDYKGQSQDYKESSGSTTFVFALGLLVVFLVLAAQFESYIHPLVIMMTVPLAVAGALFGLYMSGGTINIYTQIGLIMLIGLAAKNGILIVEFANQLRDEGMTFDDALLEAAEVRLRPIVMTGITTVAGSVPLLMASGAGAETRASIGMVVFSGVLVATVLTTIVVPVAYSLLARRTGAPGDVARRLETQIRETNEARKPQLVDEPASPVRDDAVGF
ncbi:MAG: efflux RND transporter permease subunit [Pseudomonadota bacterium]